MSNINVSKNFESKYDHNLGGMVITGSFELSNKIFFANRDYENGGTKAQLVRNALSKSLERELFDEQKALLMELRNELATDKNITLQQYDMYSNIIKEVTKLMSLDSIILKGIKNEQKRKS